MPVGRPVGTLLIYLLISAQELLGEVTSGNEIIIYLGVPPILLVALDYD